MKKCITAKSDNPTGTVFCTA